MTKNSPRRRSQPAAAPKNPPADQPVNPPEAASPSPAKKQAKTAPSGDRVTVVGTLRLNPRGFAFVDTPEGTVFLSGNRLGGFLDADRLKVVARKTASGDLVPVRVSRVGRTRSRVLGEMATVDGTRVLRLDPGVGVGTMNFTEAPDVADGTVVEAELTAGDLGRVRIVAQPGDEDGCIDRFLLRHRIPVVCPPEAAAEARAIASNGKAQHSSMRRDLTEQLVLTIDADHSKDLDDALAVLALPDGSLRVWVHIADVSEVVTPGTAIDRAAAAVPTSVYLPGKVRSMLPAVLSDDLLSLLPGVERDVLTAELRIDGEGTVTSVDLYESRIRSRRRCSYIDVAALLSGEVGDGVFSADEAVALRSLHTAASRIGLKRAARGGSDAFRSEVALPTTDDDGAEIAHVLVERLMVAANEAVAGWLAARGLPGVFRVHDPIDGAAATELEKVAAGFGFEVTLPRPVTPLAFAAFAAQVQGSIAAPAVWDAVLGLLGRARYSVGNTGHFGLGAPAYLHFTSPIRRYADVLVHRIVKDYLRGARSGGELTTEAELTRLAAHITDVAERASLAERDARAYLALRRLDTLQNPQRAVVTSVSDRGLRVRSAATTLPGVLTKRGLAGANYDESRRAWVLPSGLRLAVGSRVEVNLHAADPLVGRLEVTLAGATRPARGRTHRVSSPKKATTRPSVPKAPVKQSDGSRTRRKKRRAARA